jgi:hypothetical protein
MRKNAPPCRNTATRGSSSAVAVDGSTPTTAPAQEHPVLTGDGIALATFWRGPRDHSRAVQFAFREYNGSPFLDVRQYVNSSGFMIPTSKGLTISPRQLGRFAEAAGKAYREAVRRGLVTATGLSS